MSAEQHRPAVEPTRRSVLRGGAAAGVSLPLLVACGSQTYSPTQARPKGRAPLVSAAEVPVRGGKILADKQVVVTQPDHGEFKAFSAVCTHLQCLVSTVRDGVIVCPCHGSEFSIKDGSVVRGPASTSLPSVPVHVRDGEVLAG